MLYLSYYFIYVFSNTIKLNYCKLTVKLNNNTYEFNGH